MTSRDPERSNYSDPNTLKANISRKQLEMLLSNNR